MNGNLHKHFSILQGFKYFPVQFIAQVDNTLRSVIEPEIDNEVMFIFGFNYFG